MSLPDGISFCPTGLAGCNFQKFTFGDQPNLDRMDTNLENLDSGILRDFSEHGKLREFCATSGKNCNKQSILVRHSNICVKQLLTG